MAEQYTPEPYDIITYEHSTIIHSDDGVIAEFSCCDHEANARRFVACTHACKGLTTKELEFVASRKDDFDRLFTLCGRAHNASAIISATRRKLAE